MKRIISYLFCLILLLIMPLSACKAEEQNPGQLLSPLFLVVDLNGNGKIDTIPLEESNVYFDVDGDGFAERTEWIAPEDGFIAVYDKNQDEATFKKPISIQQYMNSLFASGEDKVKVYDKNQDGLYDAEDFFHYKSNHPELVPDKEIQELFFYIYQDLESDGFPNNSKREKISCKLVSFVLLSSDKKLKLRCEDKNYIVTQIQFKFEDSNVIWQAVCDSLPYAGAFFNERSVSQFQCLEQGYKPQGMWSSNIWEKHKVEHNKGEQ